MSLIHHGPNIPKHATIEIKYRHGLLFWRRDRTPSDPSILHKWRNARRQNAPTNYETTFEIKKIAGEAENIENAVLYAEIVNKDPEVVSLKSETWNAQFELNYAFDKGFSLEKITGQYRIADETNECNTPISSEDIDFVLKHVGFKLLKTSRRKLRLDRQVHDLGRTISELRKDPDVMMSLLQSGTGGTLQFEPRSIQ